VKTFVLDSYALLAYFEGAPGAEKVQQLLEQAKDGKAALLMSVVNWGEVYYSLFRSKGSAQAEHSLLIVDQLPIKLIEVGRPFMHNVARLKASHAIALGDCFAAALAVEHGCSVMTGDKEFHKFGDMLTVEWLE
jgi:ribonuclease VapC